MSYVDIAIPLLLLNFFTLMLLHLLPKCKPCCCQCCQTHCYPVHQFTALDPNNPFELIQWPLSEPEANIEMQVIKLSKLPTAQNFKCVHCGKVNQLNELIEWPLPEPETNFELQEIQSSNSAQLDVENDETKILSETKNDIKLPVLPRFPDITACK